MFDSILVLGGFMLKRILSAIVLCLIFIPLFLAGGKAFMLGVGIVSLLAFKEMLDLKKSHSKIPSGILLIAMASLIYFVLSDFENGLPLLLLAVLSIIFLLPTLFHFKSGEYETRDAFYLIGLLMFLGMSFHSIILLREQNFLEMCYVVMIPILTDTFALIFGKAFGKRKISPEISPNKTYAGCIGGTFFGSVVPTIFYYFMISKETIFFILLLSILLSFMGQLGDLVFSKIKRENGIKDFSHLIPEHGGILDRFDSLIFVVLTFMVWKGFF